MNAVKRPLPSFVQAVKRHGDGWLSDFWQVVSCHTYLAMRERRTDSEARSALTMELCTAHGRLFQVERPVYRCGCNGLCPRHPECPGVVYDAKFPYVREAP